MREHQIVITLKPEQFVEVQRLSKMAGAKSMGMFVRQKLLAALEIDAASRKQGLAADQAVQNKPDANAQTLPASDFKRVASELRRLHGELKTLVVGSISGNFAQNPNQDPNPNARASGVPGVPNPDANDRGMSAGPGLGAHDSRLAARLSPDASIKDELEELAERTFADSPVLGVSKIEIKPPAGSENDSDPLADLLGDVFESEQIEPVQKEPAPLAAGEEDDEELAEDTVVEVSLPIHERHSKTRKKTPGVQDPPSQPLPPELGPDIGGPPPRKRQQ